MEGSEGQGRRLVGSAAVTAVLQLASMGIGALLAVLIVQLFGKDAQTDGVLAAYGVYSLIVVLAQTFRATIVPRLTEDDSGFGRFDEYLGATLALFVLAALPLVALGGPIAALLTGDLGDEARDAAQTALLWFWVAAGGQLVAALGAALLATRNEFALPGGAYVAGGITACVVLAVASGPLDVEAVAVGVAAGSAVTVLIVAARLLALGYRPSAGRIRPRRITVLAISTMLIGAAANIIGQLNYVITIGFAAHLGEGAVTIYSYAFFGMGLLVGVTSAPAALVMAAPIARDWDRRTASLRPHLLDVVRTGLVLLVAPVALAAACGDELAALALGGALTEGDRDVLIQTFLALSLNTVTVLMAAVPTAAAFALGQYRLVGGAAAVGAGAHVALSALALQGDRLEWLGAATTLASVIWLSVLLRLLYGPTEAPGVVRELLGEVGRVVLAAAVAYGVPLAIGFAVGGVAVQALAWIAGTALFAVILRARLTDHWALLGRIAGPVRDRLHVPAGAA